MEDAELVVKDDHDGNELDGLDVLPEEEGLDEANDVS